MFSSCFLHVFYLIWITPLDGHIQEERGEPREWKRKSGPRGLYRADRPCNCLLEEITDDCKNHCSEGMKTGCIKKGELGYKWEGTCWTSCWNLLENEFGRQLMKNSTTGKFMECDPKARDPESQCVKHNLAKCDEPLRELRLKQGPLRRWPIVPTPPTHTWGMLSFTFFSFFVFPKAFQVTSKALLIAF